MKRIDIYTIDIGGGHIAPAQALKQQFDKLGYKDLDVRVVNLGIELGSSFFRYLYKFYWNNALRYPPLINAFYRNADDPILLVILDQLLSITMLPRLVGYLERRQPDLVVSTYFTFTRFLELLKRVGQLRATTVMLNPEPFDSHSIWFSNAFDWSMVFSTKSRDEIATKGFDARKVKVFPFPVRPSFQRTAVSRDTLRRRLGLARDRFTVLFFFGAEGVGPLKKFLSVIADRKLNLQAAVICGRNEKLRRDLEAFAQHHAGPMTVKVHGYVTNIEEHIAAADVVVGKSGPNQVFETLLQERPIIISSYLANERETTLWVIRHRVGWLTRTPSQLATHLALLARSPRIIEEYRQNIRRLKLRSGAPEICRFLYQLVQDRKTPRRRTVADAIRDIRERVIAEGEKLNRRIENAGDLLNRRIEDAGKKIQQDAVRRRKLQQEARRRRALKQAARKSTSPAQARKTTGRAPGKKRPGPAAKRAAPGTQREGRTDRSSP